MLSYLRCVGCESYLHLSNFEERYTWNNNEHASFGEFNEHTCNEHTRKLITKDAARPIAC